STRVTWQGSSSGRPRIATSTKARSSAGMRAPSWTDSGRSDEGAVANAARSGRHRATKRRSSSCDANLRGRRKPKQREVTADGGAGDLLGAIKGAEGSDRLGWAR